MLITKTSYKKKYVIGGAGIFGSIGIFYARMFSSNAAKQLNVFKGFKSYINFFLLLLKMMADI